MTRQIAVSILLVTWTILIASGSIAYMTTRAVLLNQLDTRILERAAALPALAGLGVVPTGATDPNDRFLVRNDAGETIKSPPTAHGPSGETTVVDRKFVRIAGGQRLRTLTIRVTAADAAEGPLTVVYSGSAQRFDAVLNQLAMALAIGGLLAGMAAAWAAVWVARLSLKPLQGAASVIGTIDEAHLDRRIQIPQLPPELHPIAERLNEMLARLEQACARQRRFMAEASHELRTPVAALMTSIEVALRRPREADSLRSTLNHCLGDATMLRQLVDGLMRQARAERIDAGATNETFDLVPILLDCLSAAARIGSGRRICVTQDIPASLLITGDRDRFRSVVINLLSNAVEYNRDGGEVHLTCRVGDDLVIAVRDTGIGIPPESLGRIFETFYREPSVRESGEGHLGLGLSTVEAHLKVMGGRCEVSSDAGHGSTFTVHLPRTLLADQENSAVLAERSSFSHLHSLT
ncbi:MAG: sensor histidine kinase [Tepidisphaeraceae bacterium]